MSRILNQKGSLGKWQVEALEDKKKMIWVGDLEGYDGERLRKVDGLEMEKGVRR